jgi:hypothetical protein
MVSAANVWVTEESALIEFAEILRVVPNAVSHEFRLAERDRIRFAIMGVIAVVGEQCGVALCR